jgi:hypothetical protein
VKFKNVVTLRTAQNNLKLYISFVTSKGLNIIICGFFNDAVVCSAYIAWNYETVIE